MPMIEVQGLTRYYGRFAAVLDASFTIVDREVVGLLGLNGAGKSTILKILAGLLMPSGGRVTVGGIDATRAPDVMRRRIGFLPEDPPLYREMRVAEFLQWVGQVKGCRSAAVAEELPRVLALCNLEHVSDQVIAELSHGYRKRVGIAQAIIHRPDVVILDEPISGLDPLQIVEMRKVVRSLTDFATVVISSHILSEIEQTCDRILVIHRGKIVAEGTEQQLGRSLGDEVQMRAIVSGTLDACERVLSNSPMVRWHEVRPDGKWFSLVVRIHGDDREAWVRSLVEAGLGVRAVQDSVGELEQIFLGLTQGGNIASDIPRHGTSMVSEVAG